MAESIGSSRRRATCRKPFFKGARIRARIGRKITHRRNILERTMKQRLLILLCLTAMIALPMTAQAVPRTVVAELGSGLG